MAAVRNGDEIPPGFDKDVWYNLQRISKDPKYKEKSEAMRHANSMRRTLGRTGPKGELGIVEDLREKFGRSPDPDEIEDEMKRDKGYGGTATKKRRGLHREGSCEIAERKAQVPSKSSDDSVGEDGSDGLEHGSGASTDPEGDTRSPGRRIGAHDSRTPKSNALQEEPYVQALLKRLADLEAQAATSNLSSTPTELHAGETRLQMPPHSQDPDGDDEGAVSFLITGYRWLWCDTSLHIK